MKTIGSKLLVLVLALVFLGVFADLAQAQGKVPSDRPGQLSILALIADVEALKSQVAALESENAALAEILAVLSVNGDGDLEIVGANLHIRSGAGDSLALPNGKGNLIIGYDETDWGNDKSGSHHLVIGPFNTYTGKGGMVVGWGNTANALYASVSGGRNNTASAQYSSVSGGQDRLITEAYFYP